MQLEIGKEYKWTELHNFLGGQSHGGISTPIEYKYVFINEYKKSGRDFGYEDGWDIRRNFYLHKGEGLIGDMKFIRGNRAIRNHKKW